MAAVSRTTGIGQHTLRAWERRFGVPRPTRLPSGHRRFTDEQVRQLRLVARALAAGHRPSDVVSLPASQLEALLVGGRRDGATTASWMDEVLEQARAFDREGLARSLHQAFAVLGLREFLRDRLAPLTEEIGRAWSSGRLEIRHEHFLTGMIIDTLRGLRTPLESAARARPLVLSTLPGERHALGLHMVALLAVLSGRAIRLLGLETPVDELLASARELRPLALCVSVTEASAGEGAATSLARLAGELPADVALWIGGAGARRLVGLPPRVQVISSLDALERHLLRAVASTVR